MATINTVVAMCVCAVALSVFSRFLYDAGVCGFGEFVIVGAGIPFFIIGAAIAAAFDIDYK